MVAAPILNRVSARSEDTVDKADRVASDSHIEGQPTIAVVGDGQLARMMQPAAAELGQSLRLLASDTSASAAQIIPDVVIGDYTNLDDLHRVASGATAVTFDHEHVPPEHLRTLQAEGVNVEPGPDALLYAQDKLAQRKKLREMGLPVPPFMAMESVDDARQFWHVMDGEVCIKACRGGYDGHGVWFPESEDECADLVATLIDDGTPAMAERKVHLVRELSAMIARTPSGESALWPVVESVQKDGICWLAIAPAPGLEPSLRDEAQRIATRIATELGVTGVMAVELFETTDVDGDPAVVVNELAMRPHNTGHWTQDGCVTSQFEQHMRAVADMPLGSTAMTANCTVMANVLGGDEDPDMAWSERMVHVWKRFPEAKIHFYGKGFRPGRKIGHVNISASLVSDSADSAGSSGEQSNAVSPDDVRKKAQEAAYFLVHGQWPETAD
nr:5-(carboxyamino)imidazole ribonucleotide synthase [Corynebacterium pseudokroppenstedtii]